jgi:assimilatory nitrate reductase catalytic subunit
MARLPDSIENLVARFGPSVQAEPAGGWQPIGEADRLVKTHCCFCGQQCGIQLKVKDEQVVGFEPWEEFPFNKGKLCPKGVKRYMQNAHADRLLSPLERVEGSGFRALGWEAALDRVASEMKRIQGAHGNDAFAVLTGASLTNEKAYLMGKFARVALRTANIDYNGRLCMVSAGAASKKVFGIDRSANPWSDIPKADVLLIAGSNVAECSPITTDYVWQARENGAKIIVLDPRLTPIARTVDLFIPVKPGGDIGIFNAMLHVMIRRGWIDRRFIEEHTTGWEAVEKAVEKYTPEYGAKIAGVPASLIVKAAELWGPAKTSFLLHARGIEHHSKGVENCMAALNLVVGSGRIGREGCGYAMITGQGNGQGAREQGQKCDQLPGARDVENPEHRKYIAGVWGVPEESIPHKGLSAVPLLEAIHDGRIKGLLLICFNPLVSLPDQGFIRAALEKLEFFAAVDFFLSETARHADVVLPGSLMEEDEGTTTNVEGRVIHHQQAVRPPAGAREDWRIICDLAARLGAGDKFGYASPREIFEELRVASKGGISDYSGITWEKIDAQDGVFWPCPSEDHPGSPRLFTERFNHPDGRARMVAVPYRPPAEEPGGGYPFRLTTGRVVYHYLSGAQTRRLPVLNDQAPEPWVEIHPAAAERLGVASGDRVRVRTRRSAMEVKALVTPTIRPDTLFIPFHYGHRQAVNQLTNSASDPGVKIPEFKACAATLERLDAPAGPSADPVENFDARSAPDMFPYASGEGRSPDEKESKTY